MAVKYTKGGELEYKVRFERLEGSMLAFHCSEWDNEKGARKLFDNLKSEKKLVTVWAELCYASIDDNAPDEVVVIDDFSRKVFDILGHKMVVG